jgi:hypothetical protein
MIVGAAASLTLTWSVVVLLTAGHSFAPSDEGFYLLLYRWWRVLPPNFTGVNYLYGPVFDLLGHNIVALRVFRLATVLATYAAFGSAFMAWLRTRRPNAPATRWWEAAGATALVASGGIMYSWLPLSPGYDDVSTLGGLLAGAITLRIVADIERGKRIPAWLPLLLGPVAVLLALAKWSSALSTFAVIGIVGINAVRRRSWKEVGRVVAWAVGGLLATFAIAQLALAPLASILIEILRVNHRLTQSSTSIRSLLAVYQAQVIDFGTQAVEANLVVLAAAIVAVFARSGWWRWLVAALAVAGGAVSLYHVFTDESYVGGGFHGSLFTIALIGVLMVPLVVWLATTARDWAVCRGADTGSSLTQPRSRSWGVLIMLLLLPITQAGGSTTGVLGVAINSLAAWVAVLIAIVTGLESAPATARWLSAAAGAVVLGMTTSIAVTGLWSHPYRAPGRDQTTASVPGVPALAGIHLDPQTAQGYADLYRQLRPYINPPGRAFMAFDEIAGLVLVADGRPVGEAWVGAGDPMRSANSMRAACLGSDRWWGDRAPILLFNRPVTDIERETVRICGYDFDKDYRLLAPPDQTGGIQVYVPVAG